MLRATTLWIALVTLVSCNGGVTGGGPATDVSGTVSPIRTLAIRPAYTKIVGIGKTVQLIAHVWLTEGNEEVEVQDVLNVSDPIRAEWTTDNFGIASVDEKGLVTAVSSGDTFIHVRIDGKEAIARIIVEAESSKDPSIDIAPIPPP